MWPVCLASVTDHLVFEVHPHVLGVSAVLLFMAG